MRDWTKYDKGVVFRDKTPNGLLFQFLAEYKAKFGGSINPSCRKCLNDYYNNYLKSITMSKTKKCDYLLKAKYNGIQIGTNGDPIRNGEMTNEIAKKLIAWHPAGEDLFEITPDKTETKAQAEAAAKAVIDKRLADKAKAQKKAEEARKPKPEPKPEPETAKEK